MASILAQFSFTDSQQQAVQERAAAVAVTAGAGSGKTLTLVGRYLALLEEVGSPEKLAAITFTEKAAREMRSRVRQEIERQLAEGTGAAGHDFWEAIYAVMDSAPIGTIHSLCARILRTHPAEAAVDPAFDVLEEGAAAALRAAAVDTALAWAAEDTAAAALFALLGEQGLRQALSLLMEQRLAAPISFAAAGPEPLHHWRATALTLFGRFLNHPDVAAAVADLRALRREGLLNQLAADKLAQTIDSCLVAWEQVEAARDAGDLAAATAALPEARQAMRPHYGRQADWPDIERPRAALTALRDRYDADLAPLFKRPLDWTLDEQAAALLPQLERAFRQARDVYEAAKTQRRALDFDDLEAQAVNLLEEHAEVRAFWQAALQAVLVDEFQDTNDRQRRIVYALTGFDAHAADGRLFVVGDAKQSIYRFRGADVTVFRRVQRNVVEAGGVIVDLDTTFRSHAPLVGQLNALLAPLLDGLVAEERPFAVPFAPLRAFHPAPRDRVSEPFVELCLGTGESPAEGRQAAAQALARRLRQLHDEEGFGWGEMGLLCRASTSFPPYEDALEAAGIPFVTVAGRGFYERPEVRDLLNALRAIANPRDDRALAGLLRSPALALTDVAIYLLRRGADERERSLWPALKGELSLLPPEDAARARRAVALIGELRQLVGRVPVAQLLKAFLDWTNYDAILRAPAGAAEHGDGGGAATLSRGGDRARRNVDKLLADAHASGLVSVGEFLTYVETLRDVGVREGEATVEADEAVQLMTVHKAKGLEFPLVVIGDAGRRPGGGPDGLLLDELLGPVLALKGDDGRSLIYQLAQQRDEAEEEAEGRRLLYVAATRARQKLLISGQVSVSSARATPGKLLASGWLGLLGDQLGLDGCRLAEPLTGPAALALPPLDGRPVGGTVAPPMPALPLPPAREPEPEPGTPAIAWPPPLLAPIPVVAAATEAKRPLTDPAERPRRVWRAAPATAQPEGPAWVVGVLFHEALRRWRFPGSAGFAQLLALHARERGLTDPDEISATIRRATRLLERFQRHELYRQLAGARRLHEAPYTLADGTGASSRVVDLLYERDGRWQLVDFKTDRLDERSVAGAVTQYRPQVMAYVTAVTHFFGAPVKGWLCFLDVSGEVRLVAVD